MVFICIPFFFGVNTRLKVKNDGGPYLCPRCHNVAVNHMKRTRWFELFFIPLIPFSFKDIYLCTICQWCSPNQPPTPGTVNGTPVRAAFAGLIPYSGGYREPNRPGYQPIYITPKYSPPAKVQG